MRRERKINIIMPVTYEASLRRKSPGAADKGASSKRMSTYRIRMREVGVVRCGEGIENVENDLDGDAHGEGETEASGRGR